LTRRDGLRVDHNPPVEHVREFLERDVDRNLFILNDLCAPYAPFADVRSAVDETGDIVAVVLFYSFPGDESLWPVGSRDGVRAILGSTPLPGSTILVRLHDAAAVADEVLEPTGDPVLVQRMVLNRASFRVAAPGAGFKGRRVRESELSDVDALWNVLTTDLFPDGAIFGIWDAGNRLCAVAVAMAGNGVKETGTVGGVHVDPALRGRGLGKAVTSLACRHWFDSGRERVVLNVAANDLAAIATCRAIGFVDLLRYTVVPVRQRVG
jgi:ribosomal protein S18 acetylase RimI-like enzyme